MVRPNYRDVKRRLLFHSAKGSTWDDHKYIQRIDGTYYYPDSYEGGRHLPDNNANNSTNGSNPVNNSDRKKAKEAAIKNLIMATVHGRFGSTAQREVQARLTELIKKLDKRSAKVSEVTEETIQKVTNVVNRVSSSTSTKGINMEEVLSVYRK